MTYGIRIGPLELSAAALPRISAPLDLNDSFWRLALTSQVILRSTRLAVARKRRSQALGECMLETRWRRRGNSSLGISDVCGGEEAAPFAPEIQTEPKWIAVEFAVVFR